jgi:hypothetical protein
MASMCDRLIQDYFGVDYELVWDVLQNRIPELRAQIVSILEAKQADCGKLRLDALTAKRLPEHLSHPQIPQTRRNFEECEPLHLQPSHRVVAKYFARYRTG